MKVLFVQARGPIQALLPALAGLLYVFTAAGAWAQDLDAVLHGLDAAKERALSSRATADVRFSSFGSLGPAPTVQRETTVWAFAGEKWFYGSNSAGQGWDGSRLRVRIAGPTGEAIQARFGLRGASRFAGKSDPIGACYRADSFENGVWFADLARKREPERIAALKGKVRLRWSRDSSTSRTELTVTFDPARGYMAEEQVLRGYRLTGDDPGNASGGSPIPTRVPGKSVCRVREAKCLNGLWIPTHIVWENRFLDTRQVIVMGEWRSGDLTADVDDRLFWVFRPGNVVWDGLERYRFTDSGDFELMPRPKTGEQLMNEALLVEYGAWLLGGAMAAVACFLAIQAIGKRLRR